MVKKYLFYSVVVMLCVLFAVPCPAEQMLPYRDSVALKEGLALINIEANRNITGYGKMCGRAAMIMGNGDVKSVAKVEFFLLPFPPVPLIRAMADEVKKIYGSPPEDAGSPENSEYWTKVNREYRNPAMREVYNWAKSKGRAFSFKTDFDGNYSLDNIPPGYYYVTNSFLCGDFLARIGSSLIGWEVPIEIKAGQTLKLDLSNDNGQIHNY